MKVGGRDIHTDIAVIHKTWEVVGKQAQIVIDANRGLTTRDTILISQQCKNIPIRIEQPYNSLDEIQAVRNKLTHSLFVDENSIDV